MNIKKVLKVLFLSIIILCLFLSTFTVSADSFTYSSKGKYQYSPDAMKVVESYDDLQEVGTLEKPTDILVKDKKVYIADKGNNRIVILKENMEPVAVLTSFNNGGTEERFNAPSGVFVAENGDLYVADSMNGRVVVFDKDLKFKKITAVFSKDVLPDDFVYQPAAIAVNKAGRMFIISANTNMGVMMVSPEGEFEGFIGAQRVSTNAFEIMKRAFMTDEQLERSASFVPVEYSNITIDDEGFIFVTSDSIDSYDLYSSISTESSAYAPIKKLNPSGTDVLRRYGFFSPVGKIDFDPYGMEEDSKASAIGEVCLLENGQYLLVDTIHGYIFVYDSNSNLLYAFGGIGDATGKFNQLVSASYSDGILYTLDGGNGKITLWQNTPYGTLLNEVCELREKRDYEGSSKKWNEIIEYNNNFDIAYLGIGKDYLDQGDYQNAMRYFKLIDNGEYYMRAFAKSRQIFLNKYGMLIFVAVVILIFALVKLFGKITKYNEDKRNAPADGKLISELMYAFYVIFHPFKGFYEIKCEKRGSARAATILLAAATFSMTFNGMCMSFGMKSGGGESIIALIAGVLLPVALWCIANWCFTSLMDGKGKMQDIYIATSYSLCPIILLYVPVTLISHAATSDEFAILTLTTGAAIAWTLVLIFVSNITIHEYELGTSIVVCLLSILGMAIILFLCMVFFNLLGDIVSIIKNIYTELSFR